jgi:isopenicillin N synthase-like dioxygenase
LNNWKLSVTDIAVSRAAEQLEKDGFLILSVSASVQESLRSVFAAASMFFRESDETKYQNQRPRDMGYRPYAAEYSKSPLNPDQVESFSVSAGMISGVDLVSVSARILCESMLTCYAVLESIAEELVIELAKSLGKVEDGDLFRGELRHWSRLQLNYSKPKDVQVEFINESHEDGSLLTIAHTVQPGLEVELSDEKYLPITNSSADVLVIPGDIAWLLSGGILRPMVHRVRPVSQCSERMALLFFADINPKLCQPWVSNEVNRNVDIGSLVLKNPTRYGLEEWEPE